MQSRMSSGSQQVREMNENDIELIRERIAALKEKLNSLQMAFASPDTNACLTPEK